MIDEKKEAVSSGKAWGAGICRIGETILQAVVQSATNTKQIAKEKGDEARLLMQSKVAKADKVRALGKSPEKITFAQLKSKL